MDKVSFTSLIRPVQAKEFSKSVSSIDRKNFVPYPWTFKQSVKAPKAYTTNICDCTVLGLTDGKDVFMAHLCPTQSVNHNRFELRRLLALNMDMKSPNLQAVLIGSKNTKISQKLYDMLKETVDGFQIPCSELKISGDSGCSISTAYSAEKDEWLISCAKIDKLIKSGVKDNLEILKNVFKKVNISDCDEIA